MTSSVLRAILVTACVVLGVAPLQFFRSLDVIATALTTVATGGGQPNSYPNGCGDPLARPA